METSDRLPDLGIGVSELSLRIVGKITSFSDYIKSVNRGYAIIDCIRYTNSPGNPSVPTYQLPFGRDNPLKTSSMEKYTLLGKSKVGISHSLLSKFTLSVEQTE